MGLERMKKFRLSHIPDADLTLLACRDQEMVLTSVEEGSGPGLMTAEGLHTCLPGRQKCVPDRDVSPVLAVARCGEDRGAATLEHHVRSVLVVGGKVEIGGTRVGRLPESSVTISITHPKLVPLLGEHDLIDLGKYSRLSDSSNLRCVTPLPDGYGPILAPTDVEGEVGVGHQSSHSVTLLPLDHVTRGGDSADTLLLAPGTRLCPAADAWLGAGGAGRHARVPAAPEVVDELERISWPLLGWLDWLGA